MGGVPESGRSVICDWAYESISPSETARPSGLARTTIAAWLEPSPSEGGASGVGAVSSQTRRSVACCESAVTDSAAPSQKRGVVKDVATKDIAFAVSA